MKYTVTIEGHVFEIVVDGDHVEVSGETRRASLIAIPHTPLRQLAFDGGSKTLAMSREEANWVVQLEGRVLAVHVEDERSRQLREMTGQGADQHSGGVVRAPMPGLVLRIDVEVGQAVEPGTGVLVLEAMKMENEIRAGKPGVVSAVRVGAGEAVEKGTVLVELAEQS